MRAYGLDRRGSGDYHDCADLGYFARQTSLAGRGDHSGAGRTAKKRAVMRRHWKKVARRQNNIIEKEN
jgi:hypothetical protein